MKSIEQINELATKIIEQARAMASGSGRASNGPSMVLTDGRASYSSRHESHISGAVQAAIYVESAIDPIIEALRVSNLHDAACTALDTIES